jgi:predicted transcriptional regulator
MTRQTKPWKHIYGIDRGYTRRVDQAREREAKRVWDAIESDPVAVARIEAGLADIAAGRTVLWKDVRNR